MAITMAASAQRARIISDDVAQYFEEEHLMKPIENNKRKISTLTISPLSSLRKSSRSILLTTTDILSQETFNASFNEQADEIDGPANLRSQETFAFIGFNNETAAKLCQIYINYPDDPDDPFGEFLILPGGTSKS